MANRIHLIGSGRLEEDIAGAALTPGHLIEAYNASGTKKVRKHSTEGGYAERGFALEDALQGREIDTAYAADERVSYVLAAPGDVVYAYLKAGENVAIGAKLISAGDGTLIAEGSASSGTTVKQIIGQAEEALDLSASGATDTRLAVRVL